MELTDRPPDADAIDVAALPTDVAAGDGFCRFDENAWRAMLAHARSTLDREVGGVIAGRVARDARGRPFVRVMRVVPALAATSAGTSVTFTADAWTEIHATLDAEPDAPAIVGWYHTHPDFGVFLSEMDLFIHEHFFAAPYQVAIVIDPIRDETGAFVWRGGALVREAAGVIGEARVGATPPTEWRDGAKVAIGVAIAAIIALAAWLAAG